MTPPRDLSRRMAIVDRLRTEGWSTYTRTMPATLADAFGRPVARPVASAWIGRLALGEGLELLPSTMTIFEAADGNVRISVLARPVRPLDPDPLGLELLELEADDVDERRRLTDAEWLAFGFAVALILVGVLLFVRGALGS